MLGGQPTKAFTRTCIQSAMQHWPAALPTVLDGNTGQLETTYCWCAAGTAVGVCHTRGYRNAPRWRRHHIQDDNVDICGRIGILRASATRGDRAADRLRGNSMHVAADRVNTHLDALEVGVPDVLVEAVYTVICQAGQLLRKRIRRQLPSWAAQSVQNNCTAETHSDMHSAPPRESGAVKVSFAGFSLQPALALASAPGSG
jgi:hypothetical protein